MQVDRGMLAQCYRLIYRHLHSPARERQPLIELAQDAQLPLAPRMAALYLLLHYPRVGLLPVDPAYQAIRASGDVLLGQTLLLHQGSTDGKALAALPPLSLLRLLQDVPLSAEMALRVAVRACGEEGALVLLCANPRRFWNAWEAQWAEYPALLTVITFLQNVLPSEYFSRSVHARSLLELPEAFPALVRRYREVGDIRLAEVLRRGGRSWLRQCYPVGKPWIQDSEELQGIGSEYLLANADRPGIEQEFNLCTEHFLFAENTGKALPSGREPPTPPFSEQRRYLPLLAGLAQRGGWHFAGTESLVLRFCQALVSETVQPEVSAPLWTPLLQLDPAAVRQALLKTSAWNDPLFVAHAPAAIDAFCAENPSPSFVEIRALLRRVADNHNPTVGFYLCNNKARLLLPAAQFRELVAGLLPSSEEVQQAPDVHRARADFAIGIYHQLLSHDADAVPVEAVFALLHTCTTRYGYQFQHYRKLCRKFLRRAGYGELIAGLQESGVS